MASTSHIAKNERRKAMVARLAPKREALKKIIVDSKRSPEERDEAARKLRSLPRNSSPVRIRNRCVVSGRPRAYYRKFGLSRIALRDLALRGELPGVIKASW